MLVNLSYQQFLPHMAENSVQLALYSPPYGQARTYGGFVYDARELARMLYRVMAPGGAVVVVVGDTVVKSGKKKGSKNMQPFREALIFVDEAGFQLHDDMIYKKLNFSNPAKTRYHQTHEYVLVFSKGKLRTFNPLKDRVNKNAGKQGAKGKNTHTKADGSKGVREVKMVAALGQRHSVWDGKTRGQEEMCKKLKHPAMMPKWLARDLILSFSNPGDVVLDPMVGSGTVPGEACKLGRKWIGCDSWEAAYLDAQEYMESIEKNIV